MDEDSIIKLVRNVYPDAIAIHSRFLQGFDLKETIIPIRYAITTGKRTGWEIEKWWYENYHGGQEMNSIDDPYLISHWCSTSRYAWKNALERCSREFLNKLKE